jgi:hypothetical protein
MITIKWTIEQLQCMPQAEGQTNVVTTIHWRATGTDGNHTATNYGTCGVNYKSGDAFTEFSTLTEEQVCEWVWANGVDKANVEAGINQQIALLINPPIITPTLPWNAT